MRIAILVMVCSALITSCTSTGAGHDPSKMSCDVSTSDFEAARNSFFFAFPLYEMYRMRQRALSPPEAKVNQLRHRTTLSGPKDRYITTPNNDTLYSAAWLDFSDGPVRFSVPAMGARYHSVELMDMFSDAFAVLRNETEETLSFMIVGPDSDEEGGPGEMLVQSPTRDAWLVIRTHVMGSTDLIESQRLQQAYTLTGSAKIKDEPVFEERVPSQPDGRQFLKVVNTGLARGPAPKMQVDRMGCYSQAGIGQNPGDAAFDSDTPMMAVWNENIEQFYSDADDAFQTSGYMESGWRYPQPNIARFGTDDVYRSAMALGGLAALPQEEAINPMTDVDANGQTLVGANTYRLRIPGNIPVDGFWSLTLYESDGSGRWFFYENAINRYAISSTTSGLDVEEDGSIVLQISNQDNSDHPNWMPAPEGEFRLVFRAYRPQESFLDGTFRLPPVTAVD